MSDAQPEYDDAGGDAVPPEAKEEAPQPAQTAGGASAEEQEQE